MPLKVIFSDLDGTLLDSADYSFEAARPMLGVIKSNNVPLILCSSKTRAEIESYRHRMENEHPFISENGGGILIPQNYFTVPFEAIEGGNYQLIKLGISYEEIRDRFARIRKRTGAKVRGFGDMTPGEIAVLTGLSPEEAILAKQRDFEEPFVFEGEPDKNFFHAIEEEGLHWTQGRIFHLMGNHDKGRAVKLLVSLYERQSGTITSIGLGDSLNDLPMLQAVDYPVLTMHENGSFDARVNINGLIRTKLAGPAGWNQALQQLLSDEYPSSTALTSGMKHESLVSIFNAALAAVNPYNAVRNALKLENGNLYVADACYDLAKFDRIMVIGAGKASSYMALAIEELLGAQISTGLVITKEGHTLPLKIIAQIEASHPVPNAAGMEGAQRITQMAQAADEKTLVICLLSGGASALMAAPISGLELQDKQQITSLLLKSGATISELNSVRKHLSAIKGGRLAQAVYPAQMMTLILSDVIGNPLDVIASGPTAQDSSSFADALAVVEKYGLQEKIPVCAMSYLQRGMAGQETETVKDGDPCLEATRNIIVGDISLALQAAAEKARQLGYATEIANAKLQGEARDTARLLAEGVRNRLDALQPGSRLCLLYGGETTVTVKGSGKGGRNQELALAFALEAIGMEGIALLSAGTDGGDGPTDAAGAIVDGKTAALAHKLGLDPLQYLNDNDSYSFFRQFDALSGEHIHFITGPTGTNVMDIQIILLERPSKP
ncbi:MAG: HAD-IIB family hydrolase [Gallionellaceae bacterium]|nr:HAD-IIB family hydrolase [Gallionellaceae bacterium]